ncbi:M3 family oligoendopeptidase [Psychrilyobacter atlanticus]|uniref:M3 family oligoendopeptidase n=1 Tax=Psychrilyobacter atlanticus TaxID=271091 RepID=UPI00040C8FE9|nr:M3 family oligoendopeptidase [Psychrilyobacter atlanticus]
MNNWNLDKLYPSFDSKEFNEDLIRLDENIAELNSYKDRLDDKVETVEGYIKTLAKSATLYRTLGAFSSLTKSTNTSDSNAIKYINLLSNKYSETTEIETRAKKWIANLDIDEMLNKSDFLKEHEFYLRQIKENNRYILDEKTEFLLSKLGQTGATAWSNLHGALTSTLDVEINLGGEDKIITLSEVRNLAQDKDANIRKIAFEAELKAYKKIEKSIASSLNSIKGEVNTINDLRGYEMPISKTLTDSRMTKETLDALLDAIKEYLPYFRKYLKRKGEILGYENGLPFYGLFAPIGSADKTFTIEEAQDYVLKNFGSFSPKLRGVAERAFNENWVDYTPKKGKVGGAFCANIPPIKQSRILHNFTGTFSGVLTLAHELGHAYHGDCIFGQSILNTSYTMPVAETASIMCETIVMKNALLDADNEEKIFLLESSLQDVTQVTVDILSRYIFEETVFNERKDNILSSDQLKEIMLDAQKKSYGDGLDEDTLHPYMWVNKGHYYRPGLSFYNFPYAFGALFGRGLYSQYLKDREAFLPKYDNLLKLTGQKNVEDVAKLADIDVTDIAFWRSSLEQVKEDIELFLELTENYKK